jgi:hypothetical protein
MGVFGDVFEGDSQNKAAEATRSYLNLTKSQTMPVIEAGYGNSLGFITGGGNQARTALGQGYETGRGDIGQGYADAQGFLTGGAGAANGYLEGAKSAYTPLSQLGTKYGGATSMALNALGVNGAQGQTDARSAFSAGPGYNFNMDQGLEAINRRRAAGGMLDSGNADRDAQTYGAGLASQEYDKWLSNLIGFTNPELSATSGAATGVAGLGRDQASLANTTGVAQAGLANQRGTMLAQLGERFGSNMGNLAMTEGKNLSDLSQAHTGQVQSLNMGIAPMFAKTYKDSADARTAGSANAINAGMEVGKAIASGGTSMFSGGPFASGANGGSGNGNMFPSSSFLQNGMSWG